MNAFAHTFDKNFIDTWHLSELETHRRVLSTVANDALVL